MATHKKTNQVTVFTHVADGHENRFVPAGLLKQTPPTAAGAGLVFAYGRNYVRKPEAIPVDPVALPIADMDNDFEDKFPRPGLTEFGGIRDAAPDAWGRRMIEAKLKAKANELDEFTYLVEAGADRVGALDVRRATSDGPLAGAASVQSLPYLMQVAEAVECVFRSKVATNSGPIQPLIPIETSHLFQFKLGHSFRFKPATRAG